MGTLAINEDPNKMPHNAYCIRVYIKGTEYIIIRKFQPVTLQRVGLILWAMIQRTVTSQEKNQKKTPI